jgi:hypothetical protein
VTTRVGERLTAAYRAQLQALRTGLLQELVTPFRAFESQRPVAGDADAFVQRAVPLVAAAQRVALNSTVAYLRTFARAETGSIAFERIEAQRFTGAAARGGVEPAEVYIRPFTSLWFRLGMSVPYDEAFRAAQSTLERQAVTDVQLVARNVAAAMIASDERIRGWRRAVEQNPCDLCASASHGLYRREDAMPLHPRDTCTPVPDYTSDQVPVAPDARHTEEYGPMLRGLFHHDA